MKNLLFLNYKYLLQLNFLRFDFFDLTISNTMDVGNLCVVQAEIARAMVIRSSCEEASDLYSLNYSCIFHLVFYPSTG